MTGKKERKTKSINRNSHNHRFPEETKLHQNLLYKSSYKEKQFMELNAKFIDLRKMGIND
jgi:hypothetical protein